MDFEQIIQGYFVVYAHPVMWLFSHLVFTLMDGMSLRNLMIMISISNEGIPYATSAIIVKIWNSQFWSFVT